MRKILCVVLSLCLMVGMGPVASAENMVEVEALGVIQNAYELNGYPSYYEHTSNYTINATMVEDIVDFYLAVHATDALYHASVPCENIGENLSVSIWEHICEQAIAEAEQIDNNLVSVNEELMNPPAPDAELQDTYDDLEDILQSEIGGFHPYRYYETEPTLTANVYIYEAFQYDIDYVGQKSSSHSMTMQAFASLVGCASSALGVFLGLAFDEAVPAYTTISYYQCITILSRQGRINGDAYYTITHYVGYDAFDDVEVGNDVEIIFDEITLDYYLDDRPDVFESTELIAEETVRAYNAS